MSTAHTLGTAAANPFAMMLDPQAVIARVEASSRLGGLSSRICRPLDRPLLQRAAESDAWDAALEGEAEQDTADDGL